MNDKKGLHKAKTRYTGLARNGPDWSREKGERHEARLSGLLWKVKDCSCLSTYSTKAAPFKRVFSFLAVTCNVNQNGYDSAQFSDKMLNSRNQMTEGLDRP